MSRGLQSLPRFYLLLMLTALLGACSGGKPESVVETFYRVAASGDVEAATKLISFADFQANEMIQAKGKTQMIIGEMQRRIDANEGLDEIKVVKKEIDPEGKTATVNIEVTFKNGKKLSENHRLVKQEDGWKIKLT